MLAICQVGPAAVEYCSDQPPMDWAEELALNSSTKSHWNGAPVLPPPPNTWLIRTGWPESLPRVGVGVAVLVAVAVGVAVDVTPGATVLVAVRVGVGATWMRTEPSSAVPTTFWPVVLPNDGGTVALKPTKASTLNGGLPAVKRIVARLPSGRAVRGGVRSTMTMSISPSLSPPL